MLDPQHHGNSNPDLYSMCIKMIMDVQHYNIGHFTSCLVHVIDLFNVSLFWPFERLMQKFSTLHVVLSSGFSATRDLCVPGNGIAHPESCSASSTGTGRPRALFRIWNSLFRIWPKNGQEHLFKPYFLHTVWIKKHALSWKNYKGKSTYIFVKIQFFEYQCPLWKNLCPQFQESLEIKSKIISTCILKKK